MKCQQCVELNEESTVHPAVGFRTSMAVNEFYDEHGVHHRHDPNTVKKAFICSRGHAWEYVQFNRCPCGWTNKPEESR